MADRHRSRVSYDAAVEQAQALIDDSVKLRMTADVPVGAFLSGGIDSSLVVASMRQHHKTVRTFSVAMEDEEFDESRTSAAVARHLGTAHESIIATDLECRSVAEKLPALYDEPLIDSSQIPTYLVSQLARRSVTVALSGDGADELFGGYVRYQWARQSTMSSSAPIRALQNGLSGVLPGLSPILRMPLVSRLSGFTRLESKLQKLALVAPLTHASEIYAALVHPGNADLFPTVAGHFCRTDEQLSCRLLQHWGKDASIYCTT